MDFKPIPDTYSYYISESGTVYDEGFKPKRKYKNGDGYITTTVRNIVGKLVTMGVHRLLMLTYKPHPNSKNLIVNHLDEIIENNDLDNLDWDTAANNAAHAALICESNRYRIEGMNDYGDIQRYYNLFDMVDKLGVSIRHAWHLIRDDIELNGFVYKQIKRNDPKAPDQLVNRSEVMKGLPRACPITVYDTYTQETEIYETLTSFARKLNVTASLIHQMVTYDQLKLVFGRYIVKRGCVLEFNYTDDEIKEAVNRGRAKEVIAKHESNNITVIYESASAFIHREKLSKKAVSTTLKKRILRKIHGWTFVYLADSEMLIKFNKE